MIERKGKLGLGTAYITGFKWAINTATTTSSRWTPTSATPNDLPRLYHACHDEGADVAIGSRYISGVNVVNWPMGRVLMSCFASEIRAHRHRTAHHDTTAGFKCYRRRVLETIPLDKIKFKGYAFQIEDRVHRLQVRIQGRGSARHLHQPRTGNLENEFQHLRRSRLRSDAAEMGQLVQKYPHPQN